MYDVNYVHDVPKYNGKYKIYICVLWLGLFEFM